MDNKITFIKTISLCLGLMCLSNTVNAQFVTNGSATDIGGGCYRMTTTSPAQVGTIFSNNTIDLSMPFTESGSFNFGGNDANGADGITFLFTTSNTAMGVSGGGIGFQGITPSFVVEYDTWVNGDLNDPNSDHVGIVQNGDPNHGSANGLVTPINYPNLEDGQEHCFSINWNPVTLTFSMTLDGTTITYNGDISAITGTSNVFYGFTSSTGGSFNEHVICFSSPTLVPMQDMTICEGESAQLEADPNGLTYNWNNGTTLSSTTIANPTATPTFTTTYTVEIGFACGNTQTDDVTVFVTPSPTVSASNDGPVCIGETLNLMASGGATYMWSGPNGFTSNQQNPIITNADLDDLGIFTVIVMDASGCSAESSTFVDVLMPIPAIIFPPGPICEGDGLVQLQAIPPGGVWGGIADANGFIFPSILSSGIFIVTYDGVDGQGCNTSATLDVFIQPNPTPNITTNGNLCEGSDLTLMGSNPGITYIWSGPAGFSSSDQNPVITDLTLANSGTYSLTVFQFNGCFASNSANVMVLLGPLTVIDPVSDPICYSNGVYQMSASPAGGTWGGIADAFGNIDPTFFPTGSYTVTYTFDDGSGCIGMDEILVDIAGNPTVSIDPAGPFCDSDSVQTLVGNPGGGTWSGEANINGEIDPQQLGVGMHDVTYTFTDGNGCSGEAMLTIEILSGTSPSIASDSPFCQSDAQQVLVGSPAGGTWGGVADAAGIVTPANLPSGLNEVTYAVTPQGGCLGEVSVFIEIFANPTATISGMGTICDGSNEAVDLTIETTGAAPIEVTYGIDGNAQPVIQFSTGTNTLPVSDAGEYTILNVVDANGCVGTGDGSAMVEVVDAPLVIDFLTICDQAQENYVVTFEIIDGNPDSYSVFSSVGGMLSDNPPYIFTSGNIPSGDDYDFLIDDVNSCTPTNLTGSFSCQCITNAGTMNTDPISICEDEMVMVIFNNDETLDANDSLIFVLHDGNGNSLGMVFDESTDLTFELLPTMMAGVTYYVSSVAGNSDGMGGVDSDDGCLSVAFGTPVTWQALPDGILLDNAAICEGAEAILTFNLTGNAPFDIVYFDGDQNFMLENILDGHTIMVMPDMTTTYSLIDIMDSNTPSCANTSNSSVTITVNSNFEMADMVEICEGNSIFLAGEMQTEAGIYVDTLNTQNGCDSIIMTTLVVNEIDTTFLTDSDCNMANVGTFTNTLTDVNNCDSVIILTVTFSNADSTFVTTPTCDPDVVGEETMTFTTPQGCDSVVIETFFLVESDTTELFDTSCNPNNVGIFETVLTNQANCDSTIILTVTFTNTDSTFVTTSTCDPDVVGEETMTFTTPQGCDSVVIETFFLVESDTTEFFDISCNPNEVGIFETVLTNQANCDSTIILTVTFEPLDTTFNQDTTCDPMQEGIFINTFTTNEGCDSVVIETIILLQSDTTEIMDTSCDPNSVGVFESTAINQFGCDSLVILTITFSESDTLEIMDTTCDPNLMGVFITDFVTAEGCDSTVIETIVLLNSDTTEINDISCNPNDVGIFETIFPNQNGCDSTVILTVIFEPIDTTFNDNTTCDPMQAGIFTSTIITAEGCDSIIVETITLLPSDITTIDLTSCEPIDTGTVIVVLMNQFGCDSMVITTTTLLPPNECGVQGVLAGSLIGCDETVGRLTLEIIEGTAPFSYEWSGTNAGMGNVNNLNEIIDIPNLAAGSYTVFITDGNGFETTLNAEIEQIFAPDAFAEIANEITCFDESDGSALATGSGGQFPYAFQWSTNEITPTIDNLFVGEYMVTVTDANDCTDEAAVTLTEPNLLELTFTFSNIDCFGNNDGFVIAQATGGGGLITYSLNGGDFQSSNSFLGLTEGAYEITAQDASGCSVIEAFAINAPIPVEVNLGDDFLIGLGDDIDITALVNYPFEALDTIVWSGLDTVDCENCLTQVIAPIISTTISVSVTAENGCSDSDALTILVNTQKNIFAPNVFSPNNDGENEWFYLQAKAGVVKNINTFEIFNRWGETVYQYFDFLPNNPTDGWNGTHRGKPMNPAVFVWFAEVEFIDGKVEFFEGDVTLMK
ncbi:MAG: gliding motility-associated-like protein [Paraglaciecola sp.]|jgi:gliding motility-associated-like protein